MRYEVVVCANVDIVGADVEEDVADEVAEDVAEEVIFSICVGECLIALAYNG